MSLFGNSLFRGRRRVYNKQKAKNKLNTGQVDAPNVKKWRVDTNPLDREKKMKEIAPTSSEEHENIKRFIKERLLDIDLKLERVEGFNRGNARTDKLKKLHAKKKAWQTWLTQLDIDGVRPGVQAQFAVDFRNWLVGRGKENDHLKTQWYRQPIKERSVIQYMDGFIEERHKFLAALAKLKATGPRDINEAYLYFKYIVRSGDPHQIPTATFLSDWDKFSVLMDVDWPKPKNKTTLLPADFPHIQQGLSGQEWKEAVQKSSKIGPHATFPEKVAEVGLDRRRTVQNYVVPGKTALNKKEAAALVKKQIPKVNELENDLGKNHLGDVPHLRKWGYYSRTEGTGQTWGDQPRRATWDDEFGDDDNDPSSHSGSDDDSDNDDGGDENDTLMGEASSANHEQTGNEKIRETRERTPEEKAKEKEAEPPKEQEKGKEKETEKEKEPIQQEKKKEEKREERFVREFAEAKSEKEVEHLWNSYDGQLQSYLQRIQKLKETTKNPQDLEQLTAMQAEAERLATILKLIYVENKQKYHAKVSEDEGPSLEGEEYPNKQKNKKKRGEVIAEKRQEKEPEPEEKGPLVVLEDFEEGNRSLKKELSVKEDAEVAKELKNVLHTEGVKERRQKSIKEARNKPQTEEPKDAYWEGYFKERDAAIYKAVSELGIPNLDKPLAEVFKETGEPTYKSVVASHPDYLRRQKNAVITQLIKQINDKTPHVLGPRRAREWLEKLDSKPNKTVADAEAYYIAKSAYKAALHVHARKGLTSKTAENFAQRYLSPAGFATSNAPADSGYTPFLAKDIGLREHFERDVKERTQHALEVGVPRTQIDRQITRLKEKADAFLARPSAADKDLGDLFARQALTMRLEYDRYLAALPRNKVQEQELDRWLELQVRNIGAPAEVIKDQPIETNTRRAVKFPTPPTEEPDLIAQLEAGGGFPSVPTDTPAAADIPRITPETEEAVKNFDASDVRYRLDATARIEDLKSPIETTEAVDPALPEPLLPWTDFIKATISPQEYLELYENAITKPGAASDPQIVQKLLKSANDQIASTRNREAVYLDQIRAKEEALNQFKEITDKLINENDELIKLSQERIKLQQENAELVKLLDEIAKLYPNLLKKNN
jgi:hypothetical protein